jgi:putative transposase
MTSPGAYGGRYRYRSRPTQAEEYLLTCQRYIELSPVRAGMVEHPAEYR